MLEFVANTFSVFGGIFLIISIIAYLTMDKKVENPNCPEDVRSVAFNKKWGKIVLIANSIIVAIGLICLLFV